MAYALSEVLVRFVRQSNNILRMYRSASTHFALRTQWHCQWPAVSSLLACRKPTYFDEITGLAHFSALILNYQVLPAWHETCLAPLLLGGPMFILCVLRTCLMMFSIRTKSSRSQRCSRAWIIPLTTGFSVYGLGSDTGRKSLLISKQTYLIRHIFEALD